MNSPIDIFSPNATPAGGQDEFTGSRGNDHDGHPHVYVMYWPQQGIIKVGVTEHGNERWNGWLRRGAVLLMIGSTCCMEHACRIEGILHDVLGTYGARAFRCKQDARDVLGRKEGGWTECYRLVQSPRFGEEPEHEYDFERAYGLILPTGFDTEFHNCDLIPLPVTYAWRKAS